MSMQLEELREYLRKEFPQMTIEIESVGDMSAVVRQKIDPFHLRPGNTVSGPALMMVVDCAFYAALVGTDASATGAVTTNLNINFINRAPADRDIIGKCNLFKVGSRLATGEVIIYSEGLEEPIAHATLTFAIPGER